MPFIQNIFFTNLLLIQNKIQHKNLTFMYNRVNYRIYQIIQSLKREP